jgi:hypothetical protein
VLVSDSECECRKRQDGNEDGWTEKRATRTFLDVELTILERFAVWRWLCPSDNNSKLDETHIASETNQRCRKYIWLGVDKSCYKDEEGVNTRY